MNPNGQSSRTSFNSLRKRIENYSFTTSQKLGSGYSSQVYRGRDDRDGSLVAIKVVNLHKVREKKLEDMLMRQIKLLQELSHQNMISCLDALMTNNNCYIVTDLCPEGDLASHLTRKGTPLLKKGRIGTDQALKLILQIATAVAHLHQKSIIHRDIKPQNILLNGNRPKLADFGFAIKSEQTVRDCYRIGTPLYMSPEAMSQKEYSKKSDVWSFGVTIYQILQGKAPWLAKNEKQLKEVLKNQIKFKHIRNVQLQALIQGCLTHEVETRLNMEQILVQIEQIMGMRGQQNWSERDKENFQSMNKKQYQEKDQIKKSIRRNYSLMKWLINYSRFVAKLLPKIEQLTLTSQAKNPWVEFTARCLHMTISKLHRVDQLHGELGLINYPQFTSTSRCAKIKSVTEEYHKKYLLMLAKLPYTYSLPKSLAMEIRDKTIQAIKNMSLNEENLQQLRVMDNLMTLIEVNQWAQSNQLYSLSKMINFEKLIDTIDSEDKKIKKSRLQQRKRLMLNQLTKELKDTEIEQI